MTTLLLTLALGAAPQAPPPPQDMLCRAAAHTPAYVAPVTPRPMAGYPRPVSHYAPAVYPPPPPAFAPGMRLLAPPAPSAWGPVRGGGACRGGG